MGRGDGSAKSYRIEAFDGDDWKVHQEGHGWKPELRKLLAPDSCARTGDALVNNLKMGEEFTSTDGGHFRFCCADGPPEGPLLKVTPDAIVNEAIHEARRGRNYMSQESTALLQAAAEEKLERQDPQGGATYVDIRGKFYHIVPTKVDYRGRPRQERYYTLVINDEGLVQLRFWHADREARCTHSAMATRLHATLAHGPPTSSTDECDHIIERADGGTDHRDNLQWLKRPVHVIKSAEGALARMHPPQGGYGGPLTSAQEWKNSARYLNFIANAKAEAEAAEAEAAQAATAAEAAAAQAAAEAAAAAAEAEAAQTRAEVAAAEVVAEAQRELEVVRAAAAEAWARAKACAVAEMEAERRLEKATQDQAAVKAQGVAAAEAAPAVEAAAVESAAVAAVETAVVLPAAVGLAGPQAKAAETVPAAAVEAAAVDEAEPVTSDDDEEAAIYAALSAVRAANASTAAACTVSASTPATVALATVSPEVALDAASSSSSAVAAAAIQGGHGGAAWLKRHRRSPLPGQ
jgi:hypothetical protein